MAGGSLKVHVKEISPVLVELEVQVPWTDLGTRLDRLYAKVGRDARIRGFRKGKAPRHVLERYFGESVTREALSEVIEVRLVEAIRQSGRRVVATRGVQPGPIEAGKPLQFTAKIEVIPSIEKVDTEGLVASRPRTGVSDEDVDREVERLRQEHAELVPIDPPRPAQKGDIVLVDYEATLEGSEKPASKAEGRRIELGEPSLIPGFEAALLGASEGDRREANITFPEDHARPDLRGKTAGFVIRVREIRAKVLPELDDELARDLGEHDTLEELRTSIRERIGSARRFAAERAVERSVLGDLARKNPIPLPASLVEAQLGQMESELLRLMAPQGGQDTRLTDDIRTQLRAQAEQRVRGGLLVSEIARREGVEITDDEIDAFLDGLAAESGKSKAKVRAEHAKEDRRERIRSELLEKKVVRALLDKAEIRDIEDEGEGSKTSATDDESELPT